MDDLISRKELCEYALNQKDKSVTPNDIMRFPSAQPVNDCISRKAAIDRAVSIPMFGRDIKMIATSEIERLPSAQPEQRWIPCSESSKKLPEDRQKCLVTLVINDRALVYISTYTTDLHAVDKYDFPDSKSGWYDYDPECGYYEDTNVVAWMPLPEPYAERRQE